MAASVIGALRVNLGLDSAQFEKGAKRSQNTLKTMRNQFAAIAGVAAAMGAAISAAALKGAQDIDRAAKAARRLDSSIGGFRALELAAGEAGVSVSTLADAVQTMDREIAKGSKGAGEALKRLGLAAKDLEGLDADQKIAKVADAIQNMGLSTADASVVLQQLGIRNREMVLAVMSGGEALRQARADIESYGLAISRTDSDAIEKANDQIGRLGLISQYAGQQLAISLVPAMGRLAEVMTDSLREGGLLRSVIDGLVGNLDRLGVYVGVAVAAFGTRYVAALVAARLATFSLSGALLFLRTAILRTGIGILIVGAGEMVLWFSRLVTATGGWGGALEALGDLASGVWEGIATSAEAIPVGLNAVWSTVLRDFNALMSDMASAWASLMQHFAANMNLTINTPFGSFKPLDFGGAFNDAATGALQASTDFAQASLDASVAADDFKKSAAGLAKEGFETARAAAARLAEIIRETGGDSNETETSIAKLNDAIDDLGESAGGKGAGGAKALSDALKEAEKAARDAERAHEQWANNAAGHFDGLITGGKSFSDVLKGIARQLESTAWQQLFQGMGGGSGGGGNFFTKALGFLGGGGGGGVVVPQNVLAAAASFSGGGYTGNGPRSGGLDGQGGFMAVMHPRETVIDHTKGQGAGGGGRTVVELRMSPDVEARVLERSASQSVEITRAGLRHFQGEPLTQAMRANGLDPRLVRS